MKSPKEPHEKQAGKGRLPSADELAALRAWYAGLSPRAVFERYLNQEHKNGASSRAVLSGIRLRLAQYAKARKRTDLAALIQHRAEERVGNEGAVLAAIELLRQLPIPKPLITDEIGDWLQARTATALKNNSILTLADLVVRIRHRRRWWANIPGLGIGGARYVDAFFAKHPELFERANALVSTAVPGDAVPWERLRVPSQLDGSHGTFRAPPETCILSAKNDYEAVQAWLSLQESTATMRAYRKEAERLILWAVIERGKPLSSLTTEDAVAYRAFLRSPTPTSRWVGPATSRTSIEWRPFTGNLSAHSVAYALSVLGALFRWLIQQRYALANPFAGIKVRGGSRAIEGGSARAFTDGEWAIIHTVAEELEWGHGWNSAAAQRLLFILKFAYATGLRNSELVQAKLGDIEVDRYGEHWLKLVGKGGKPAKVALPTFARSALDLYLLQRRLPLTRSLWDPQIHLIGTLSSEGAPAISTARLWAILKRFFNLTADAVVADNPGLASRLRQASPHWMRHTHATHALARGVDLTTVRDNMRHASLATTSIYLHSDEVKRARQLDAAFAAER